VFEDQETLEQSLLAFMCAELDAQLNFAYLQQVDQIISYSVINKLWPI
jgi:hypothetical protein